MTFVSLTNILLVLLCIGVLVQSARLMRSVQAVRSGDLGDTVRHLDRATDQARDVLADLKRLLTIEGIASVRAVESAEELRDELSVMIGIGNAVADRIMEAADAAKAQKDAQPVATRMPAKRAHGSRGRGGKVAAAKIAEKVSEKLNEAEKDAAPASLPAEVAALPSASLTLLPHLRAA